LRELLQFRLRQFAMVRIPSVIADLADDIDGEKQFFAHRDVIDSRGAPPRCSCPRARERLRSTVRYRQLCARMAFAAAGRVYLRQSRLFLRAVDLPPVASWLCAVAAIPSAVSVTFI